MHGGLGEAFADGVDVEFAIGQQVGHAFGDLGAVLERGAETFLIEVIAGDLIQRGNNIDYARGGSAEIDVESDEDAVGAGLSQSPAQGR